jgi:hypothetical protein
MEKISKNCYKGELITDYASIYLMAFEKRSIYYVNWGIKPAMIYLHQQFWIVDRLIRTKQLFTVLK